MSTKSLTAKSNSINIHALCASLSHDEALVIKCQTLNKAAHGCVRYNVSNENSKNYRRRRPSHLLELKLHAPLMILPHDIASTAALQHLPSKCSNDNFFFKKTTNNTIHIWAALPTGTQNRVLDGVHIGTT